MKNVQVRFSDDVYAALDHMAKEESTTIADVVRKGIQLYGIMRAYRLEGKKLAIMDDEWQVLAELVIPGITANGLGVASGESVTAR